ncbi:hypothetical protein NIES2098_08070 [Calothrix sp. NIES-2098]|nr:hypothetical protein NIES2098_08070 [Calothrix sp. NIES-2098]
MHLDDEFCNAIVNFSNSSQISLNIWSAKYFYNQVQNLDWLDEQVAILPDIVLRDFNAASIQQAITNLVTKSKWLEGRGFPIKLYESC